MKYLLDANAWIGMGLEEELSGNFQAAERYLLHAAAISREYVPRWTLANYYFRRENATRFWPWAKQGSTAGVIVITAIAKIVSGRMGRILLERTIKKAQTPRVKICCASVLFFEALLILLHTPRE